MNQFIIGFISGAISFAILFNLIHRRIMRFFDLKVKIYQDTITELVSEAAAQSVAEEKKLDTIIEKLK